MRRMRPVRQAYTGSVMAHVEVIWKDAGEVRRKFLPWRSTPATAPALSEWIENYPRLVARRIRAVRNLREGYRPNGFGAHSPLRPRPSERPPRRRMVFNIKP